MSYQQSGLILPSRLIHDPVVITGIGIVSPLGSDRESTWSALLAGERAGRWLTATDLGTDSSWSELRFSGNPAVEPVDRALPREITDHVIRLGLHAALEAWSDARLGNARLDRCRMGCVFGTSKGSLHAFDRSIQSSRSPSSADDWCIGWPSAVAAAVSQYFDLQGPCVAPVAACATGVAAIVRGVAAIQAGECDLVVAGSADDSLHPGVLASFQRLGVLARGEHPAALCRPFDRSRQGFVVGAGAGCLILERRSVAIARGVPWYAEVVRGRLSTDPAGMTQLSCDGDALAHLIKQTCDDVLPDLVQLHGTGTRTNDPTECQAVRRVFGAAASTFLSSGVKGALGHLLGAAGSVETALACLSLRDQVVPPCANLVEMDPICDLALVRGSAVAASIETVLKLSLGFGGHQAALLLRRGHRSHRALDETKR